MREEAVKSKVVNGTLWRQLLDWCPPSARPHTTQLILLYTYVYIYLYICVCVCVYIYIYIYILKSKVVNGTLWRQLLD